MAFPSLGKKACGDRYEKRALEYLRNKNCKILAQNVTYRFGELDLVMEEVGTREVTLVFVEVRKRDPRSLVTPEESVLGKKAQRLIRASQTYLASYRGPASAVRIDLIAFHGEELTHHSNFISL
jgi:putative endonuclease